MSGATVHMGPVDRFLQISGTPVDNQIAIWAGADTLEGDPNLLWDGSDLNITGNITLTGTVDGIDIATDVAANTAKVTNATHTGQVTGATALALDVTAITAQPASGAIVAADTILINDGGVLSEASFTQMITFFDANLSFGAGDVTKVGTPVDNQLGVWTGDGTIEGDANLTWTGSLMTVGGGLTVTGAFTSRGIDDNATGERLQIEDLQMKLGVAGVGYDIMQIVDDQDCRISGGSSVITGANLVLRGGSHSSRADDFELRASAQAVIFWDESLGQLAFKTGVGTPKTLAFTVDASQFVNYAGAMACAGFTSTGIDDNTTGERLQLGDTVCAWGDGAGGIFTHTMRSVNTGIMAFAGGSTASDGGSFAMYGSANASRPGDILFKSNNNPWLFWDESVGDLEIRTGTGVKTSSMTWNADQSVDLTHWLGFPSTQQPSAGANDLDDYEEGTFTPVLSDGTNDATHVVQAGRYTKVGRIVHCSVHIQISSLGSVTGALEINGLPFTSATDSEGIATFVAGYGVDLAMAAGNVPAGFIASASDRMVLQLWDLATGVSAMDATEWSADGTGIFTFSYKV